jgi:hypothetical protein
VVKRIRSLVCDTCEGFRHFRDPADVAYEVSPWGRLLTVYMFCLARGFWLRLFPRKKKNREPKPYSYLPESRRQLTLIGVRWLLETSVACTPRLTRGVMFVFYGSTVSRHRAISKTLAIS